MNTTIAAIEENINGAAPRTWSFGRGNDGREAMKNFVQLGHVGDGDRVGRRRGGNLAGALSDRHGDEGGRHLGRDGAGSA
jgi:hypothetical protein